MRIGPYILDVPLILAPMAGVTDRPFRQLCRHFGAALAVSEMTTSDAGLWHTEKSRLRMDHDGEIAPISVQRSEEHTSELQSLMRISYAVFCLKKKKKKQ